MYRALDPSLAAEAARLYAAGKDTREVGAELGVDDRTIARWLGEDVRRRGPRGRTDVTDDQVWQLRYGDEKLSFEAIARRTGLSKTAVRKRIARLSREAYEASP